MAKNEAKIRFSAETGEFNDSIKKANQEMTELRAELKLNETQMKTTGTTVEGLEQKHRILTNQLQASQDKTEALNQKVNKAVEIYGENSAEVSKLRTQLLNAQTAEEKIRQAIQSCNDELEAQKGAVIDAADAHESLTDRIKRQQSELDDLKSEYAELVASGKGATDEAENLARSIEYLSDDLKDSKTAMENASKKADELDRSLENVDESADDAGGGFTILKGTIADFASDTLQNVIGKIGEVVGALFELPAATMELRQDMATLTTSFDDVGMSTETAKDTWKELYAVFGEDDRAVETANHIARLSDNQKDLNDWVTITTGVYGRFQDSLDPAALAESAVETSNVGTVTGALADALNWSTEAAEMFADYMSDDVVTAEDAFNVALSECATEQERQALITDTLTKLYGESADTYRDTASAQMEAKKATAEQILAEANLATAIEPVTTKFTELKSTLLTAVAPAVEKVSGAMVSAMDWMQEHPVLMKSIAVTLGVVATALGILVGVVTAYTIAQWAMNSAILANPLTWVIVGIVAAVAVLAGAIVAIVHYWDDIVAAVQNAWEVVKTTLAGWGEWINTNVIQPVATFFTELWATVTSAFQSAWDWITTSLGTLGSWVDTNVIQPVVNFFTGLWTKLQEIWNTIVTVVQVAFQLIGSIINAAVQIITLPFMFIWENCKTYVFDAWEWIKEKVTAGINTVKEVMSTVMTAIQTAFTTVWTAIKDFLSPILEGIKTAISTAWNAVQTTTSTIFNAVKNVATTVWNSIKTTVSTVVNAVKTAISTAWNAVKSVTSTVFNAVKSVATTAWNNIKTNVSNVVNGVKTAVSGAWNTVKSTTSSVFNGIKSTATTIWNGIKTAITKPIEEAKTKIKGIVDTIKGFFSGMNISFPNIKMPHFSISPSGWKIGDLLEGSIPKLAIEWYKDGGIFTKPTVFNTPYGLKGVGEAGAEAVLPIDRLEGYIEGAIERTMQVADVQALANAIEDLANRPILLNVNGKNFATATANDTDNVNGLRSAFKSRGLVLG